MVWRKAGLGRHWLSSPFEDNHREASSRISRTVSRSPWCARIIPTSDPTLTKYPALSSTLDRVRFGRYQHFDRQEKHAPETVGRPDLCYLIPTVRVRLWLS